DAIERETGQRPGFSFESFSELEPSVRTAVAKIQASPFVLHREAVRGFIYDVETGRLREVD
ncbi:MAG: carbonic anhydrase, partial [Deltaproteobacteria bacterium]|nr:carbonic anhydrase [Deltaproteobacteria bacterium]